MRETKKFTHNDVFTGEASLEYDTVDICPICKSKISPVFISCSLDTNDSASVFNFCRGCHNSFITKYAVSKSPQKNTRITYIASSVMYSEPNRFSKHVFDEKIQTLSSQFEKIYNQALAAESYGLDEIAGLGYRKALEFLIKDFAIHEHPDNAEKIKSELLSSCIDKYIAADNIKTLAKRSAWIGNDEAHYVRKQEDRDVSDMKQFIQAIVYFIGMTLITEDADTMTPK